jgi:hypothetical protein
MHDPNTILDAARAHFDKMRGQEIEIPEWAGEHSDTLVAYFDPPTLRVRQMIQHRAGKSEARQMALTVLLCLKNKDGKLIFKDDAPTLATLESGVDPKVVARIAQKILGLTDEEDLGN